MSVVRDNLMSRPGYSPYCGNDKCAYYWPRTGFNGSQFQCRCGWQSKFEDEFIAKYKRYRAEWSSNAKETDKRIG